MIIGVPKEIKDNEARVGVTPAGVKALTEAGHKVLVETQAGALSGFDDAEYQDAGGEIVGDAGYVWGKSEMVVKVKEPIEKEYVYFREGLVLFTYLHLAPLPELTDKLLRIQGHRHRVRDGARPPGHAAAADADERSGGTHERAGGRELSRKGTRRPRHSAGRRSGRASGARHHPRRRHRGHQRSEDRAGLRRQGHADRRESESAARTGRYLTAGASTRWLRTATTLAHATREADLVIGGVLIPGATAPKLVTRAMVAQMKKGAVIVDVAIDQGGCVETARPTSHSNPSFVVDGVVHYCVTNMPGAVPHTSTLALTNSTFPYVLRIANLGAREALRQDAGLAEGLNTWLGTLTYRGVAESQHKPWTAAASVIA